MTAIHQIMTLFCNFFHSIPETFVNIPQQAIVSYLCLNLAITPIFIACQTQLMLSVFSVLFFFINTAILLITLGLEYLGLAILLVYAGAIIMILLFVIMLVKLQETERQPFSVLTPARWSSESVPFRDQYIKTRSVFLIVATVTGALILTYSCRSIVSDIYPSSAASTLEFAPTLNLLILKTSSAKITLPTSVYTATDISAFQGMRGLFNTYFNPQEPNYIPWLLTYFDNLLEIKFQPIVLENTQKAFWPSLSFTDAPSYNLDRWTLDLASRFKGLQKLLPLSVWTENLAFSTFSDYGHPLDSMGKLIDYNKTIYLWDFYPRTRLGVYEFPKLPVQELKTNLDIPTIYAQEYELKDHFSLPKKDISVISSVLYTLHSPVLVLAAICLFIAMVLSFLLTDFKIKD